MKSVAADDPTGSLPHRVIIVDDNREFREVLAVLLPRILQVEVVKVFDNAAPALEFLESDSDVTVLVDNKMPGMDGITFIRQSRKLDPIPPVFLVSFSPLPEHRQAALDAGAIGVLNKTDVQEDLTRYFPPLA